MKHLIYHRTGTNFKSKLNWQNKSDPELEI